VCVELLRIVCSIPYLWYLWWFVEVAENFFGGHAHQIKVGMSQSVVAGLLSGVIQGSAIGPIMFIIYTDDLAKLLEQNNVTAKLFADDVKLYLEIANVAADKLLMT